MPTLTTTEILMDVLGSFKQGFPAINRMGTDFRAGALKLGQTYIAHIPGLPSIANYDAAQGGYKNGATSARSLLTDVPITVDQHKHVPLKWAHLDSIKDNKQKYQEVIANAGEVLAKAVVDDLLAGGVAANFSKVTSTAVADFDLDVITEVNGKMNKDKASPIGRVMLVSTDVANVIGADTRIASRDFYGQQTGGNALRRWQNVGGFAEIIEYPDFPANGEKLCAFAFESRAFALLAGVPESFDASIGAQLGIPPTMSYETVTDPTSGISMAAVSWQETGTGDYYWSPTLVWGKRLGKSGGAAGSLTDLAGHRIVFP